MALFFAYGTELLGDGLLAAAPRARVNARRTEPIHATATAATTTTSAADDDAPATSPAQPYAFAIASARVEDALLVFRKRDGPDGPIPDLEAAHDGAAWGVLFEVTDEMERALCREFDPRRKCVTRNVTVLGALDGATGASIDVVATVGQQVEARCLVAADPTAEHVPINDHLMRQLVSAYASCGAPAAALVRLIPQAVQRVEDVHRGNEDTSERLIGEIYYRSAPRYAIYRSAERVLVQYADDGVAGADGTPLADAQRTHMAVLNPLRSQIGGLIDGWERSGNPALADKARRYNARVAAALNQCLEGDATSPVAVLTEVRDEILAERASWGRFQYLVSALAFATAFCAVFWLLKAYAFADHPTGALWLAARAGTVGAFFSIALNIQRRKLLTDLLLRDNVADAALRITVGAIGAGALICVLQSGFAPMTTLIDSMLANAKLSWQAILVSGFAAGFSERLVPTIVDKLAAQDRAAGAAKR